MHAFAWCGAVALVLFNLLLLAPIGFFGYFKALPVTLMSLRLERDSNHPRTIILEDVSGTFVYAGAASPTQAPSVPLLQQWLNQRRLHGFIEFGSVTVQSIHQDGTLIAEFSYPAKEVWRPTPVLKVRFMLPDPSGAAGASKIRARLWAPWPWGDGPSVSNAGLVPPPKAVSPGTLFFHQQSAGPITAAIEGN